MLPRLARDRRARAPTAELLATTRQILVLMAAHRAMILRERAGNDFEV